MNRIRIRVLIAIVGLSLAAYLVAQQTTTNSSSTTRSGGGQATASSSASGSSRSSGSKSAGASANGSKSAGASANGSGSGFQGKATHVIMFSQSQDAQSDSASDKAFQQEVRYMVDQQAKGKVLMFGPWRDQPGAMALVMAQNDSEAEQIAKNDPAVRSGNMTYEVRAWNVR